MPKWDLETALYWMSVGDTFFVPCLNNVAIRKDVKDISRELGVSVVTRTRVEGGIKGVRVWMVERSKAQ